MRNPTNSSRPQAAPRIAGMVMKIGVMGAATGDFAPEHLMKAERLGAAIAERGCILITGGCPGLPLAAARGAKSRNGLVIGISPGLSLDEHIDKYHSPTEHHDVLIYTGSGLMGREVVNIRSSDVVIIIGGRSGTLGELAIAYDEGKLIGVLTGTGGISDLVKDILVACEKPSGAQVLYSTNPDELVNDVVRVYQEEHFRKPSCFEAVHAPGVSYESRPGLEQDVVCGMWVPLAAAPATREVQGRRYVFCSKGCAARFDLAPEDFTARIKADG